MQTKKPSEPKTDLEAMRELAYDGIGKALNLINHRFVKRTTAFAKDVLDITDKMKNGNIVSKAAAMVASIESVADLLDVPRVSDINNYIADNNLESSYTKNLAEILLNQAVFSRLNNYVVARDSVNNRKLIRLDFDEQNYVCFLEFSDDEVSTEKDSGDAENNVGNREFSGTYYLPKNFDINVVYSMFWQLYENKIFLSTKRDDFNGPIRGFKYELENMLFENNEIDRIGKEIKKCFALNQSRSYLLVGPPGVGKTTQCFAVCAEYCPRVLKVDSSALESLTVGELDDHIRSFRPDALILDDIDRTNSSKTSYFLFTLENIKKEFTKMVIFATANNFDHLDKATVRPGRFDRIIWVEMPKQETTEKLLQHFCQASGVTLSSQKIKSVAKEMKNFTHAYMKELVLRVRNSEPSEVDQTIKETIAEFRKTNELSGDEDDIDSYE